MCLTKTRRLCKFELNRGQKQKGKTKMRDGVFSKKAFYIRAFFLLACCYLCSSLAQEVNASTIYDSYYRLPSRLEAIEECSEGIVSFGTLEYPDYNESRRSEFVFEDDLVLKCDIQIEDNIDLNLSGHTITAIDGHKIYTKRGTLRIYNGTFNDVEIETKKISIQSKKGKRPRREMVTKEKRRFKERFYNFKDGKIYVKNPYPSKDGSNDFIEDKDYWSR